MLPIGRNTEQFMGKNCYKNTVGEDLGRLLSKCGI